MSHFFHFVIKVLAEINILFFILPFCRCFNIVLCSQFLPTLAGSISTKRCWCACFGYVCIVVFLPRYDFSSLFCWGGYEFLPVEVTTLLLHTTVLPFIQSSPLIELQFTCYNAIRIMCPEFRPIKNQFVAIGGILRGAPLHRSKFHS